MRARALHKNPNRHGLGIQRFLMESPLFLVGSSYATIQRRKTSMTFIHSFSKEVVDLGSIASLVFLLVFLFYGLHGSSTIFGPYFGLSFLWSFGIDFMFGTPMENMVAWQP